MKKNILVASAVLSIMTLASCRSNKNSMQSLYEQATEQDTAAAVEEVKPAYNAATSYNYNNSTAPKDRSEKVTAVNSSEAGMLKGFNVIVGSFGQMTNAEAMKNKMQNRGYNAFLVRNESGMLRVVAGGYDMRTQAEVVRDEIRSRYNAEAGTCADAWLLIPQY